MKTQLFDLTDGKLISEKPIELNVMLAYQDFSTGMHALRTFEHLFVNGRHAPQLKTQNVWKFDLLGIRKLREIAVAEAAVADMVIISVHGPGELPNGVKEWIEGWVMERQPGPGALVMLMDDSDAEAPEQLAVEAYLQACAAHAGMDCFINRIQGRHGLEKSALASSPQTDWPAVDIQMESQPDSGGSPRWGINE